MSDSDSEEHRVSSESEYEEAKRPRGRKTAKRTSTSAAPGGKAKASVLKKVPEIAKVDIVATDSGGVVEGDVGEQDKLSKISSDTLKRIQSALALAQHPNTGVAEAHRAMRVASRLMAKENITQADLIARETEAEKSKRAGMSTVDIVPNPDYGRRKQKVYNSDHDSASEQEDIKLVQNKSWHGICAVAMDTFFNVKSYSMSYSDQARMTWTFYGIAENTTAAAFAFEMVHNTIMTWSYENTKLKGRVAYNSYRDGVARGLLEIAKRERKEEEQKAIENEKKLIAEKVKREEVEREREIERLAGPKEDARRSPPPVVSGSSTGVKVKLEEVEDVDAQGPSAPFIKVKSESPGPTLLDDFGDPPMDSDDEAEGIVAADFRDEDPIEDEWRPFNEEQQIEPKGEPEEPKIEPKAEEPISEGWQSSAQLVRFRNDAETIADNFLKDSGIKLGTHRRRGKAKRDFSAYEQGKEDSKKIDIKRRRLENGE